MAEPYESQLREEAKKIPRKFWEKQPGETHRAYEAFKYYRSLPGSKRKQDAVCEQFGLYKGTVNKWAQKWMWTARAEALDAENERVDMLESREDRARMIKRQQNISILFQNKIIERLQTLDPETLSPNQLAQWFEVSTKVERLARGESTNNLSAALMGAGSREDNDLTGAIFANPELAEHAIRLMEQAGSGADEPGSSS